MNLLALATRAIGKKRQGQLDRVAFYLRRPLVLKDVLEREFLRRTPLKNLASVEASLQGARGIEIGGPSPVFRPGNVIPIYSKIASLDVCNFGSETMWEGKLKDEAPFRFFKGKPQGRQFLREATDLWGVQDSSYDFVLSSHCLEHVANPLKALAEWRRTIRPGGHLLLVVPHPQYTFDHRRPATDFEHLLADFKNNVAEDDTTHVDEILRLHDLDRDSGARSASDLAKRVRDNANNRGMHHHVFTNDLAKKCMEWAGFTTKFVEHAGDLHIVVLGRKP